MQCDKVIIYDDSCPMCRLYTYGFVMWGLLKPEHRVGFAAAPADLMAKIDLTRGRHQIPLYDQATGETIYGLEAMTHLLATRWSWLTPVFNSGPFGWIFQPTYEVITYNRRVIAGCKHCNGFDCAPDFDRFYRSVYLGLVGFCVFLIAALLSLSPSVLATIGLGLLGAFVVYGLIAGSIRRVALGSLVGWDFAGSYATTMAVVSFAIAPCLLIEPALGDVSGWVAVATASLLGVTEIRRRDL